MALSLYQLVGIQAFLMPNLWDSNDSHYDTQPERQRYCCKGCGRQRDGVCRSSPAAAGLESVPVREGIQYVEPKPADCLGTEPEQG
ncbi:hypothetical protein [Nitrosococcus wardiae]|uniref:hypothetical protein n=1 Tax=Nitrosococcus wardiae TaxID=1814290 RepID=UPI00141BAF3F|nr:hypothetical protein [Nitrosococcus wardiae]